MRQLRTTTLLTLTLATTLSASAAPPQGAVEKFSVGKDARPLELVMGQDGALWFTEETLDIVCRNVNRVKQSTGVPFLLGSPGVVWSRGKISSAYVEPLMPRSLTPPPSAGRS